MLNTQLKTIASKQLENELQSELQLKMDELLSAKLMEELENDISRTPQDNTESGLQSP